MAAKAFPAMAVFALLAAGCLASTPDEGGQGGDAFRGLVVASNPLAAQAGAEILRAGGTAADAAAAVQWALTVVEPQYSGIGGGAFLLYRHGDSGDVAFLDGRELAPALTTADQFEDPTGLRPVDPQQMGYAVGVPGTVAVFHEAHRRWGGGSTWAETFAPAIGLARGFPVSADLAESIANGQDKLRSWPASARLYLDGATCPPDVAPVSSPTGCTGGRPLAAGETLRNPDLAATLGLIAGSGPQAFYDGGVAQALVAAQAQRGGRMLRSDLAGYRVAERDPLRGDYRGHEVITAPSPGGGPVLLNMLEILEGFDLAGAGRESAQALHWEVEAMRLAYADRAAYNADPDVEGVPQQGLASPAYAAERRALIGERRAADARPGDPWRFDDGQATAGQPGSPAAAGVGSHTSHFIVVDPWGDIVAATTTIEAEWGTGMVVPGHGFLLNNELTDFDWAAGGPNEPGPAKRPRSSMVPTIVLRDGEPVLVVGAAGGPTITTSVLQVILHTVDHGLGVRDAVAAPRIYGPFDAVLWDRGLPAEARDGLAARGHPLEEVGALSGLQAAADEDGRWVGAADVRHLTPGGAVLA